jgi:hypothetical protein
MGSGNPAPWTRRLLAFEDRRSLLHKGCGRLDHVLRRDGRRILLGDVLQTRINSVVPTVEDHILRPLNGQGRTGGNLLRQLSRFRDQGFMICTDPGDEPHLQGLIAAEIPSGQCQFPEPPVTDNVRKSLQGADIGNKGHPNLPDAEDHVLRGDADIAGAQ